MGKTAQEIVKIIITILLSSFMTLVIISGTVINSKADKEYVDKEDKRLEGKIDKIEDEYKMQCKEIKEDYLRETKDIKESQKEMRSDIKELLKRVK